MFQFHVDHVSKSAMAVLLVGALPLLAACQQENTEPATSTPDQAAALPEKPDGQPQSPPEPRVPAEARYHQEIASLKANSRVKQALALIEQRVPAARDLLIELTEIPAPPFKEEVRARRIAEMMRATGLAQVNIDDVGNVIGLRPGRSRERTLALTAHIDTVFPAGVETTVRIEGSKLSAPGVGDNTRGVVSLLEVLRAFETAELETESDLMFVADVGEEGLGDLRGIKHLFREGGPKIDTFVAIDGGDDGEIVYGGIGSHRYRITYRGPGGHSWHAFGLANPHHALGRAISEFANNARSVSWLDEKTSFNIGRIGGGTSINSIPFESWMEVDMRSGSQAKVDAMDAVLRAAAQKGLDEENANRLYGPELTVEVTQVGKRPAGVGDAHSPLVQRMLAAVESFGLEPQLTRSSTDSNIPISYGIPAITISRGGKTSGMHAPDEYWEDVDSHIGPQLALLVVLANAEIAE